MAGRTACCPARPSAAAVGHCRCGISAPLAAAQQQPEPASSHLQFMKLQRHPPALRGHFAQSLPPKRGGHPRSRASGRGRTPPQPPPGKPGPAARRRHPAFCSPGCCSGTPQPFAATLAADHCTSPKPHFAPTYSVPLCQCLTQPQLNFAQSAYEPHWLPFRSM